MTEDMELQLQLACEECSDLKGQIAEVQAEVARLRELARKAIEVAKEGDYRNGIVGPGGHPDEGEVRTREIIHGLEAALQPKPEGVK